MEDLSIKEISRITDALKVSGGVDFSNYAFSSFRRRVIRFMEINKIRDTDLFIDNIKSDKSYSLRIIDEITVNVTEMFRDPSFWVMLRDTVIPELASRDYIRIWHAACSTGEEVFSMAILLKESNLLRKSKIIATDLNKNVLETAARGIYQIKNQEVNNKNYNNFSGAGQLSDYCKLQNGTVQFDTALIKDVEFRHHDLARDDSFSEFDLILCRNVLIYFNSDLQEQVLKTFSQSMKIGSFLAIGSKESIRWCREASCFQEKSLEEKIYVKTKERQNHNTHTPTY